MKLLMIKIKKYLPFILAAFLIIALVAGFFYIKSKNTSSVTANDFKLVTEVPGCEFEIDKTKIDTSTAVTEISKQINFLDYETYSFKNGTDVFIMFNMKRYVVVAKKGTSFNFSKKELSESLRENNLQGIWFSPIEKEKVKKSGNKYTVKVNAEVVITSTLYNDFVGELTTFEKNGEEWALFAGYLNPEDKEIVDMVEYVAKTFTPSEEYQVVRPDFTVDVETDQVTSVANETVEVPVQITEDHNVDQITEEIKETVPTEEEKEESKPADSLSASANKREIIADETTAYSSSIYSMLPVGSIGYMDILNEDVGKMEPAYIKITNIFSEEEAMDMVRTYSERTGKTIYDSFEIPDNCHLEALSYDIRYTSQTQSYIDLRLVSLDGDTFRHRGMAYSNKTYDIPEEITLENDWYSGNIVFYVIPNGCNEYAVRCAGIINNDDNRPAWYKIVTKK